MEFYNDCAIAGCREAHRLGAFENDAPSVKRGGAEHELRSAFGAFEIKSSSDVAKVSVIGIGMRSHAGVAAQMFKALGEKGINILAISTSEIKISVLIDAAYAELAVRTLHSLYELGKG